MRIGLPKSSDEKAACTLVYKSAGCFYTFIRPETMRAPCPFSNDFKPHDFHLTNNRPCLAKFMLASNNNIIKLEPVVARK